MIWETPGLLVYPTHLWSWAWTPIPGVSALGFWGVGCSLSRCQAKIAGWWGGW